MAESTNATSPAPVVVIPKPWWKSATVWVNALTIVGMVLAADEVRELLGAKLGMQTATGLLAAINVLLRYFKSGAPIAGSPPDNAAPNASPFDARRAHDAAEGR